MSGNENSEDENNFLSKLKELKDRNLSNSPALRKSPQKQFFTKETESIRETINEGDLEENSIHDNYNNTNNQMRTIGSINYKSNQRQSWNNSKNNNNTGKKNLSVNKYTKKNYNTEINNRRFEIEPVENKRNILNSINRITPKNNQKTDKGASSKLFKSKSI